MMTVIAQDGKLTFNPETGRWEDEDGNIGWEHKRVCSQCGKPRLDLNGISDCDFCLQALTSCDFIDNACCGHGVDKNAYISLKDGRRFVLDTVNKEAVNKLNELHEENEQLKIANARWLDKSLQDRQIRYSNTNHKELTKRYLQLKEENEKLRKELDNFKPVMFQDVRKGTVILYSKGDIDE